MKAGGGKSKGSDFEREVCKKLSRFVDPDGTETIFWRSAMSGGRATIQNRKGATNKTQLSDITCVHPLGEWLTAAFVLECKFYKLLDIPQGLINGKGTLAGFWREHSKLAMKHERAPLLIAKQNKLPTLVLFDRQGLNKFQVWSHTVEPIFVSECLGKRTTFVCLFKDTFRG